MQMLLQSLKMYREIPHFSLTISTGLIMMVMLKNKP